MEKIKNNNEEKEESVRVYQNPILHVLSKTHIALPLTIFFGSGIVLSLYALLRMNVSTGETVAFFLIGLLLFTLAEYLIHRFLYHLPSVYEEGGAAYALHGIHHKFPRDKKRLVMPPVLSVAIASIILIICYYAMGNLGFPFTGGFLFGYAGYLSVHFIVHRYKPPQNVFKALWINHSIHHYHDDKKAFGVSSPLWDYVFGTLPDKRDIKSKSPTK